MDMHEYRRSGVIWPGFIACVPNGLRGGIIKGPINLAVALEAVTIRLDCDERCRDKRAQRLRSDSLRRATTTTGTLCP
ncbi:hypothetical protein NXS19_013295 [Fusarium pseudograminearum]|nr:hypothetical protein NXS19_013295 [Fusarium pseudograminearum]